MARRPAAAGLNRFRLRADQARARCVPWVVPDEVQRIRSTETGIGMSKVLSGLIKTSAVRQQDEKGLLDRHVES